MEYSGFWRRFGALVIDSLIAFAISMVLSMFSLNSYATSILVGLLYHPFFTSSKLQGTPGKNLLGIRITDLQGRRISFKKSMIRYLMSIVSGVLLCLGYLLMLFTEKKQTLHDLAAETVVVMGEVKGLNMFQAWYQQVLSVLGMVDKVPGEMEAAATGSSSEASAASPSAHSQATPSDLAGLYDLFQKGILTEEEYNTKRAELLKKL
jgi:uncharacterized RDD family membrane protein YckC